MVTLGARRERIEELADLLDGTRTEDEVRGEVRRLATLAGTVTREVEVPVLDADARDRIRTAVMAGVHTDLQEAEQARTAAPRRSRSARSVVATGVASVVIGAGGVAVAAQEALPGDALYSIKQATESVRLAAATDQVEQGRLELALASARLEEITAAVDRGGVRDEQLVTTFERMDERSRAGAEALVRVAEREDRPELLDEVASFTETQYAGIVDVFDRLPIQVRPVAEASLTNLRAIHDQLLTPVLGGELGSAALAGSGTELRSPSLPTAPPAPDPEPEPSVTEERSVTREPSVELPVEAPDAPSTSTPSLPSPRPGSSASEERERNVVPRLPGPLDDVGRTVDDTVGGVLDGTGRLVEDGVGAVDDVLDGVGGAVDGLLGGVGGAVDGLLGGLRPRD